MVLFAFSFLLGVLSLQTFTFLPDRNGVLILTGLSFLIILLLKHKLSHSKNCLNVMVGIMGFTVGFAWCVNDVYIKTRWSLPASMEGETVTACGVIDSIPSESNHLTSFQFKLHQLKLHEITYKGTTRIRLTWRSYTKPDLHIGDTGCLKVRLKQIHGLSNPATFDFEAYALQEGIRATGYVVDKEKQSLLTNSEQHNLSIDPLREKLLKKIKYNLPNSDTACWIVALVVGERRHIDPSQWDVLRKTGTNHLMAIAGLHIGFMAGFIYFLIHRLWRVFPQLLLILPAQQAGSIAALFMALFYSALAGFSLPTQRACLMFGIFLLTRLMNIRVGAWQVWSLALMGVLIINPLSVQTISFWLSLGAVALIIYGASGRLAAHSFWWKWGRLQWVTAIGLTPFCLWLFQQSSFISFIANVIAIPWVGFIVVPLSLTGSLLLFISNKLGGFVLLMADKSLQILWMILTSFSHLTWSAWFHPIQTIWILISCMVAVCLLLLPVGFPGRWLSLIGLIPLFNTHPSIPKLGEIHLTVLDVGQGLSAIVQTQHHLLVFDTGPKLSPNYDMGASVVAPFLVNNFISSIDMLVVSHGDNDHSGGVQSLLHQFLVKDLRTSVPDQVATPVTQYCLRGQAWEWDKVKFRFLYPNTENLGKGNNSSCVLSISNGYHRILLTGDIEKSAEKFIVENEVEQLPSSILIAPHHGSKTSALDSFLEKVHPKYVLFPIGYRNRYHFPHTLVVQKYNDLGAMKMDTATNGALMFTVNSTIHYLTYRQLHHHYWNS